MVLLISYERGSGGSDPAVINQSIEELAVEVRRPFSSQWLVETLENVHTWAERLEKLIDPAKDRLFVVQITGQWAGHLDEPLWAWLKEAYWRPL